MVDTLCFAETLIQGRIFIISLGGCGQIMGGCNIFPLITGSLGGALRHLTRVNLFFPDIGLLGRRNFAHTIQGLTDNWESVNFRIFSCVLSHISTLAHRNSSKLSQYVTLVPILLSGEFKENRIIHF